jgi:hypothetical protein
MPTVSPTRSRDINAGLVVLTTVRRADPVVAPRVGVDVVRRPAPASFLGPFFSDRFF